MKTDKLIKENREQFVKAIQSPNGDDAMAQLLIAFFDVYSEELVEKVREDEGERIRKDYLKRITNHTGEFLNPWIVKTNLSHEELGHILERLVEHLDKTLTPPNN